jgi:anti-repressor protein
MASDYWLFNLNNMNKELVFRTPKGNPVTTSRLIAEKFNKRHSDVLKAIDNMECSDSFRERNFALIENENITNSSAIIDKYWFITENGFSFLAMGFTGKKAAKFKEEFIEAFDAMRQQLKYPEKIELPDFNNPAIAARAWADQYEQKQLLQVKVKLLEPKAAVFEQISESVNLISIGDAAKVLNLDFGRNKLFEKLRNFGILMSTNVPYQKYITQGYFETKIKPITMGEVTQDKTTTFVTGKGMVWLAKIIHN